MKSVLHLVHRTCSYRRFVCHAGVTYIRTTVSRSYHGGMVRQQYLPYNHPFIIKDNNLNMYTNNSATGNPLELSDDVNAEAHPSQISPPSFHLSFQADHIPPSCRLLQQQAKAMRKAIFFYNESNPHVGIILNTKQLLYDYYKLVGPVSHSWSKILLKDQALTDCIFELLRRQHDEKRHAEYSIASVAATLEALQARKDISRSKYKSDVENNQIQFRVSKMTLDERIILEALTQYAGFDYELII